MPSWTISRNKKHTHKKKKDSKNQKGFDTTSTRNNWSSGAIFPRVLPQLSRNTKGKASF